MTGSQLNRPTQGFEIFMDYEDSKFIYRDQLHAFICYLCGNVNACYSPNRSYYQDWLYESNNLQLDRENENVMKEKENMESEFALANHEKKEN